MGSRAHEPVFTTMDPAAPIESGSNKILTIILSVCFPTVVLLLPAVKHFLFKILKLTSILLLDLQVFSPPALNNNKIEGQATAGR